MKSDRVRRVLVHGDLLRIVFGGHPMRSLDSDWPSDAEIIGGQWDFDKRQLVLFVTSATFDDVPIGSHPPEWDPTFTVHLLAPELAALMERERAALAAENDDVL